MGGANSESSLFLNIELSITPDYIEDQGFIEKKLYTALRKKGWKAPFYFFFLERKSLDARGKQPLFKLRFKVYRNSDDIPVSEVFPWVFKDVSGAQEAIVVGAGPAGYFAALELIAQGIKPVVLERGKDVRDRRRDLREIQQFNKVNPDSNYCFGEGGAGTYSDGKLYTRSYKRGRIESILKTLVAHGAKVNILYDAHPHIGSNKLPRIISNIRDTIVRAGGEIHFGAKVIDLLIEEKNIKGVKTADGVSYFSERVIIATGHSAREMYDLLDKQGVQLEFKPFALGVRVEHPQTLIDKKQLKMESRHPQLSAAAYRLVCQVQERGVYSFCMCPGGLIVPAATSEGEIVVNGMSLSKRNSAFANSGIVVEIRPEDLNVFSLSKDWKSGIVFQRTVEQGLFKHGDGSQKGPAQLVEDFIKNKESLDKDLPECSYIPGIYAAPLHQLLPKFIVGRLQEAFRQFDRMIPGFISNKAVIVAVESRTSSPVRIPRNPNYESPDIQGLYPCGEGAGYAGGIISAALDGRNVAKAVADSKEKNLNA